MKAYDEGTTKHESKVDNSINYIKTFEKGQVLESRFVQREGDKLIIYLSSQTGCEMSCRMCHLTATGQNKNVRDATLNEVLSQFYTVISEITKTDATKIHINFMARGEPLLNKDLMINFGYLTGLISHVCDLSLGVSDVRFNVSTIMPKNYWSLNATDQEFGRVSIYYSMYSVDGSFRKRWLPRAMDPCLAIPNLKKYHKLGCKIKVHFALIDSENDSILDIRNMCNLFLKHDFRPDFNLVAYNPYSSSQGKESSQSTYADVKNMIKEILGVNVKIIPRVGFDIKASCGMFSDNKGGIL